MCSARVMASCSFPLLPGGFDKLRDRSIIAASASSIRCSNLLGSDSRTARRGRAFPNLARHNAKQGVIGVVPMSRAHIDLHARTYDRFELFSVFAPRQVALGVISANMGCKLLVALQLEDAHHLIERCASGPTRGFEPPATFGTAKAPKTLLLNPHQLPAHGRLCRRAPTLSDPMPSARRQGTKRSGSP